VFVPHTYKLLDFFFVPENMHFSLTTEPMQIHTMIFATFASLIAPFGGFFASGLKRTFKIKDFGHSIPGHGGMTDRMDCQFIMGFFTFMYYHSFIAIHKVGLGDVMELAINGLTVDEQVELVRNMARYLGNQGAVGSSVSACSCNSTATPWTNPFSRFSHVWTRLFPPGGKIRTQYMR
jgi:phosphatidate cytidylyltransferase